MIKAFTLFVFVLFSYLAYGQRDELKKTCLGIESLVKSGKNLKMGYTITITGIDKSQVQNMDVILEKTSSARYLKMGDVQEIFQKGSQVLVVNHLQKNMLLGRDSSGFDADMLSNLIVFIDSASTITVEKKSNKRFYSLSFTDEYIYGNLKFTFENNQLLTVSAEFNPLYDQEIFSMTVNYTLWDTAWKPSNMFPGMNTYVYKSEGDFFLQPSYAQYQLIQPDKRKLKF